MARPLAYFAGTGRAVPASVMTNHDFAAIGIETSHEWIVERSGIHERRIARDGESTCSMAAEASRAAMTRAGVQPGDVDTIILSTATPDRLLPSTAVDVQAELGAGNAAAFDISAACSGWLYGITTAEGMLATGASETALVIGAEKMSAIVDWTDRSTAVLFGDGAGAVVLRRSVDGRGILSSFMRSDGALAELLWRPGGGATTPFSTDVLEGRSHFVKMAGREVFKHAVRSMAEAADRALQAAKITGVEIDLMIPHQANVRIIEATAKHAGISMDKVYVNVDRFGNTSSASIGIALDEAIERGRAGPGSTVLLVAFGAGFTWASMVVRL
ncbi:MAG: 3-oxoacyl-[acyl-carrier-protein] synthase, KASIII [uncultured Gemmatimonadaceae bacterium]|uniref:Beta-ketoacyl-[acyl-carrier-protein] synthase III n=1 Tax=uncultured Gemmatimonadaceae bacterium TaxID=246130 RepID=A0A6J4LUS6_9BACT|nr:MAG: 3-oxoacyl-[acyl-carrier-protein] synthase, KASIII [uncultured Gemmatimonadaceae bacterium]